MPLSQIVARDGNNAVIAIPSMSDLAGNLAAMHSLDSSQQTYRFSANFTPTAAGAVTLISIQGSATKTVRVKRITMGGVSTALSSSVFQFIRTSALGAGGTAVAPLAGKNDNLSVTATAVVQHYTTTLKAAGTPVGGPLVTQLVFTGTVTTPTVAAVGGPQMMFPEGGSPNGQAVVLRGVTDFLEIQNVTPANLAAGTVLNYEIELVEDNS